MKLKLNDYSQTEVIKMIREWANMTQEEFAKSLNKNYRTIQRYESGELNYSISTIYEMMRKHDLEIIIQKKK